MRTACAQKVDVLPSQARLQLGDAAELSHIVLEVGVRLVIRCVQLEGRYPTVTREGISVLVKGPVRTAEVKVLERIR
jgi:hypothetical protein